MKRNVVNKLLALALSATMVMGLAACGGESSENSSSASSSQSSQAAASSSSASNTESSSAAESSASEAEAKGPVTGPINQDALKEITISLPSDELHADGNPAYERLTKEIEEKTGIKINWVWEAQADYYNSNNLKITAGSIEDITVYSGRPSQNATFTSAAEDGLFWDLTPYIDDAENFPNAAAITDTHKAGLNYMGKIYGLPRTRTLARSGLGYRLDWLQNLGLNEPTTLEDFETMLERFTYGDPDGNGADDTVGLFLDSWTGALDLIQLWFGVPNGWGLDENGDLIPAFLTDEYKVALQHLRQWYQDGWINNGSNGIPKAQDVAAGKARDTGLRTGIGGVGVQVLDDLRKVETYFEDESNDAPIHTDSDNPIFTLQGYVDTGLEGADGSGNGAYCMPNNFGMNGYIAISTVNIKTEEQLRRALQVLDMLCDGWYYDLFTWGWEGETYYIDDDGYGNKYDGNPEGEMTANEAYGAEIGTKWGNGFNQIMTFVYAEGHEPQVPTAGASTVITKLEQQLYQDDIPYCVPDYSAGYQSATYVARGSILDTIISDARWKYITDAGATDADLQQALDTWLDAGGQKVIDELNEQYHANN